MAGTEIEPLATELDVPPDLLWDALAHELSGMTTAVVGGTRDDCAAGHCRYACTTVCAATVDVGTSKAGRLY